MEFFSRGSVTKDYGLVFWPEAMVNDGFVSYKRTAFHFKIHELMDWSLVDYCDVFISCFDSHSDGTHSLQRIHW